jgi:phosphoribosylaminoimidazolecarboxamide formyltransferase/IMP cyclohydrolase
MTIAAKARTEPAPDRVPLKTALISVSDKTGLLDLARTLAASGVKLLSTGGTAKTLRDAGMTVIDVSDHTGFPEIMDGRVKTLHPKIHGGLLGRRDDPEHREAMKAHGIEGIDLLIVNLYPFRETVAKGADAETCIENIDIGGPALIRAAAKNHAFVAVVTDPADYADIAASLKDGGTTLDLRRMLAGKAYAATSSYDSAISGWFAREQDEVFPQTLTLSATRGDILRYGENPHQLAAVYTDGSNRPGVVTAKKLQGKELSYNNLNDTDAAFELVSEFEGPAVAIIKHANPCGVATGKDMIDAYKRALSCDPVSAFGGIIALNRPLDEATAAEIIKLLSEVIIAPEISEGALKVLSAKPNIRVLTTGKMPVANETRMTVKSLSGGFLLQTADTGHVTEQQLQVVTKRQPTPEELKELLFAFRVCKHVKSNAIVFAKDMMTVGIGAGQPSRIDSTRIASWKGAETGLIPSPLRGEGQGEGESIHRIEGMVVASDAFFPFPDGLIAAADAGATAVIQPGGSIKDKDVIAAADERGLAMVLTGMRHFRH